MKNFLTWLIVILIIAAIIAVTQMPSTKAPKNEEVEEETNEVVDLEKFEGEYQDEWSQRAVADVKVNDDKETLNIRVHWSDSASSGVIWTINARLEDNKLVYEDGLKEFYQFTSETEPETYTALDENQSGYFEIKKGKLYWLGSPEDDCKVCIFSLPQY